MKGGPNQRWGSRRSHQRQLGFTIVETLIVLSVTMAIFVSIAFTFTGKQQKEEFRQGYIALLTDLQSIMANVQNGYYPATLNFGCSQPTAGAHVVITGVAAGAGKQGANGDCLFLGSAVQFSPNSTDSTKYNVYSIVGSRLDAQGTDVSNYSDAQPLLTTPGVGGLAYNASIPDITDTHTYKNGVTIAAMCYFDSTASAGTTTSCDPANPTTHAIGAFAIISTLGTINSTTNSLNSGSQSVQVVPIVPSSLGQAPNQLADTADPALAIPHPAFSSNLGVLLCVKGGNGQYASVTVGANNRPNSVVGKIVGSC